MKATIIIAVLSAVAATGCADANTKTDPPVPADNTKKNDRDTGPTLSPLNQGENQTDITTTAEIRKQLMSNHDLSTTAQNVKIITKDGMVTLRGPVASDKEKEYIFSTAKSTAGAKSVDNQLEIAAK